MTNWRLLITPPLSASSNMALDEALFNLCSQPTLRFYSWKSPSISIGYFQDVEEGFLQRCRKLGISVVRRPTGGRAILHQFEITYSVISPYDRFPAPTTLSGIYKKLARWQVESLQVLGLKADLGERRGSDRSYGKSASCFMTTTPYEVHVGGKKICGSAQKRGKTAFLQHGSILADVDSELMQKLLGKDQSNPHTFTTLKREGCQESIDEIIKIMAEKFSSYIGCHLYEALLTDDERTERERLLKEHYRDLATCQDD